MSTLSSLKLGTRPGCPSFMLYLHYINVVSVLAERESLVCQLETAFTKSAVVVATHGATHGALMNNVSSWSTGL